MEIENSRNQFFCFSEFEVDLVFQKTKTDIFTEFLAHPYWAKTKSVLFL